MIEDAAVDKVDDKGTNEDQTEKKPYPPIREV